MSDSSQDVRLQIEEARRCLEQDRLDDAERLAAELASAHPADAGVLLLRASIARRRGQPAEAVPLLERVVSARPDDYGAWMALGNAQAKSSALAAAASSYRRAAALAPESLEAHFNLGVVARRLGDVKIAATAFHAAWMLDPAFAKAADACVSAAAEWARTDAPEPPAPVSIPPAAPTLSVVVCSIDDAKAERVRALYERLLAGARHDIHVLRGVPSLAEGYNRGIAASRGDVIIFSHDDVDILAEDFAARLLSHLAEYDVIGIAGATRVAGPVPTWSGHPYLRGWITHHGLDKGVWHADVLHPAPVAGDIAILDGVFLAARREVVDSIRFDPVTFDGFHCYDVDWSVRAFRAGFRLAAAGDLLLVHHSRGRYDQTWRKYAERFCAKHRLDPPEPERAPFFEASFDTPTGPRDFFAVLGSLYRSWSLGAADARARS